MLKKLLKTLTQNSTSKSSESEETQESNKVFSNDDFSVEFTDSSQLQVDTPYPIYGYITKILEDEDNQFVVEINHNIRATIVLLEDEYSKKELLKQRSFDCGIFVLEFSTIVSSQEFDPNKHDYPYEALCKTVIFGKSESSEVH